MAFAIGPHATSIVPASRTVLGVVLFIGCIASTIQAQEYSADGLTGHLTASVGAPKEGHTFGISFYNSVFPLNPLRSAGTQLGWGTWVLPDNPEELTSPLCPADTYAGEHWPEQAPFRHLFQTIEG